MLYYSGHGVVDKAGNYCAVPTDFAITQTEPAEGTKSRLVNLSTYFVRKLIDPENARKGRPGRPAKGCAIIVLLDMCRSPHMQAEHRDPVKDLVRPSSAKISRTCTVSVQDTQSTKDCLCYSTHLPGWLRIPWCSKLLMQPRPSCSICVYSGVI